MAKSRLRVLFALVPLVLVALGYGAGYLTAVYPSARQIQKRTTARTLGAIVGGDATLREAFASAYLDPKQALGELDGYSWSVPTTPAPFLNYQPQPGNWDNAAINDHGLRDTRDLELPKPAGVKRVFLVGGSTAYGSGAPDQERTIGAYLEAALREAGNAKVEVRTFASPAWTSTHERIAIVNRVSEWEPDVVVSMTGANDTYWSQFGADTLWARTYEDAHFYALIEAAHARAGQPVFDVTEITDPRDPASVVERFAKNTRLARTALEGVPYLVVLQPVLNQTQKPLSAREQAQFDSKLAEHEARAKKTGKPAFDEPGYWSACFAGYARAVTEQGGRLIDLSSVFDGRSAEDEVFLDALHFGDRGNQWIAQSLAGPVGKALAE